jgi:hypothetical protein
LNSVRLVGGSIIKAWANRYSIIMKWKRMKTRSKWCFLSSRGWMPLRNRRGSGVSKSFRSKDRRTITSYWLLKLRKEGSRQDMKEEWTNMNGKLMTQLFRRIRVKTSVTCPTSCLG